VKTTNLANTHPEIVQRLKHHADEMRKDLGEGKDAGPGRRPLGQS